MNAVKTWKVLIAVFAMSLWCGTAGAVSEAITGQGGGDDEPGGGGRGSPAGALFPNHDPNYVIINLTDNPYGDNQPFPNGYYLKYPCFNSTGTRIATSTRNKIEGVKQLYEIWVMDYDATTQMVSNFQQITTSAGTGDIAYNSQPSWSRTNPDLLLFLEVHNTTANPVKTYDFSTSSFATLYDPGSDTNGDDATNPAFYDTDDNQIVVGSSYLSGNDRILLFDGTYPSTTISSNNMNLDPSSNYAGDRVTYYSTQATYSEGSIYSDYSGGVWTENPNGFGDPAVNDVPGYWAFYSGKPGDMIFSLRSDLGWSATGLSLHTSDGTLVSDLLGDGGTDFTWAYGNHNWKGPNGEILFRADEYSHSGYGNNIFIALEGPDTVWVDDDWDGPDNAGGHAWGYDAFAIIQDGVDAVNGSTVYVEPGTYEEQVVINKSNLQLIGAGSGDDPATDTIIQSPVSLTWYYTTSADNYPIVAFNGVTGGSVEGLRIDGLGRGNSNYRFQGIGFWNSGGDLTDCVITNVMDTPFSGAQHGVGVYAYNNTGGPYIVNITGTTIVSYQKNAMALNGTGLTANVSGCTTVGAGPTDVTAQNGIQFWGGNGGTISNCDVTGNMYTPGTWAASGLLILDAGTIAITGGVITDNDPSVYCQETDATADGVTIVNTNADSGNGFGAYLRDPLLEGGSDDVLLPSPFGEVGLGERNGRGTMTVTVDGGRFFGQGAGYGFSVANYQAGDTINLTATNTLVTGWGYGVVVFGTGGPVNMNANNNAIFGNEFGFYAAFPGQMAEDNWWGHATGPLDPDGTDEAGSPPCFDPSTMANADGEGNGVSDLNVDYCPWLEVSPFCGNGTPDPGEECDDGNDSNEDDCLNTCVWNTCGDGFVDGQGPETEDCDGGDCCTDTCDFESSSTVCRGSAGVCDAEELCTGSDADCPDDEVLPDTSVCRASTDPCDPAEYCDGENVTCPGDVWITTCIDDDGCCPAGCNANNDNDCEPVCPNGVCEEGENANNCPQDCDPVCGNGIVEAGEECDGEQFCIPPGEEDECTWSPDKPIPTVSTWGLVVLALLLLTVAKIHFGRRYATARNL